MTKTEQAELEELGRTPEQIAAKGAEIDALVNGKAMHTSMATAQDIADATGKPVLNTLTGESTAPRKRKARSDAGKPKPRKPEPAQESPLVDDLDAAVQRLLHTTAALRIATFEHEDALTQYGRILQALKVKA